MTNSPVFHPHHSFQRWAARRSKKSPQRLVRLLVERLNPSSAFPFLAWRRNDAMLSLLVSRITPVLVAPGPAH